MIFLFQNFIYSGSFSSASWVFGMLNGVVIINNKTNIPQKYYYCVGDTEYYGSADCSFYSFGWKHWAENQIYVIPIN